MSTKNDKKINGIGERIKSFRKNKGLNLVQLADLIGISHGSLSGLENNKSKPSAETLSNFCLNTEINIKWLLTGEGPMTAEEQVKATRKYEILNEIEDWLDEQVRRNPKREEWFELQLLDSFQTFKEWRRKKDQEESSKAGSSTRKVA